MAEVKPLDPNMRQKLAAMLSGDAKAGSIRAQLVHGLLGSQTGDDEGLVGATPLGAIFNVDAANRDQRAGGSGLGHTLEAAAGLIPGAGPEAKAGREAVEALTAEHPISVDFLHQLVEDHTAIAEAEREHANYSSDGQDYYETAKALAKKFAGFAKKGDVEGAAKFLNTPGALADKYASDGVSPLLDKFPAQSYPEDGLAKGTVKAVPIRHEPIADPGDEAAPSTGIIGPRSIRDQLEAAANEELSQGATAMRLDTAAGGHEPGSLRGERPGQPYEPPTVKGTATSISDAAKPQPVKAATLQPSTLSARPARDVNTPGKGAGYDEIDPRDIIAVSGGDPHKENFIRNAMMDEGGNVPEDVADTLVNSLAQNPKRFNEEYGLLVGARGKGPLTDEHLDNLHSALISNHSIPEMLSMHYDLDPAQFKNVYNMPSRGSKPTQ